MVHTVEKALFIDPYYLGSGESRVKYVDKYRYVFRVFSLVFYKYVHVL